MAVKVIPKRVQALDQSYEMRTMPKNDNIIRFKEQTGDAKEYVKTLFTPLTLLISLFCVQDNHNSLRWHDEDA